MDKKAWIVIIACSLGLYVWLDTQKEYQKKLQEETANAQQTSESVNQEEEGSSNKEKNSNDDPKTDDFVEKTVSLKNDVVELLFTNDGGGIKEASLLNHFVYSPSVAEEKGLKISPQIVLNSGINNPIGALSVGRNVFKGLKYQIVDHTEDKIILKAITLEKLEVTKTFLLTSSDELGGGHVVKMNLGVKYAADAGNMNLNDLYVFAGSSGQLSEGNSSDLYTGLEYLADDDDEFRNLSYLKKEKDDIQGKELLEGLQWLGVSNQFFSTNIFLEKPYETKIWAARYDDGSEEGVRVIAALGLPNVTLNPGDSKSWNYEIFLGPKDYQTLKVMEGERSKIVGFDRMPIFGWIAQPFAVLLSLLMNWLHGFFGNYGWSIISITIIMRLVIWPVTAKGTRAMKKMSKLAPMMQEIKEKYKDNPQKMQQETMSLYRDYGVNPVGGCLPLLLQMPIFIGYFAMLRAAVELRHEPWLGWVTDLSLPDTVMHIAGFPINILPLLMGITMMLQMRMTPQSAGPNQKQMKIIMTIMPIFITVICYNFASALALYWTAGNIFSIGQTWVTQKFGKEVELKKVDRSMQRPAPGSPHQSKKKANKPPQIRTGGRRKKKK